MVAVLFLISCYLLIYAIFLWRLLGGFGKVPRFTYQQNSTETGFTVIVPFRNEEKNLPDLLKSFEQLDYPREQVEFIFIDDFSTDDSARVVNRWRLDNPTIHTTMIDSVRMSASPKKDAIQRAIPIALHNWIVTTDADCKVPTGWLSVYDSFIRERKVRMCCGPVRYQTRFNICDYFQQADMMALQGVTIASFGLGRAFMCNAANFAFEKSFFQEIGGFNGVDGVASGDDVFLLQKAVAKNPDAVSYLKSREAIVTAKPANSWIDLFHQRVRWASKSKSYISNYGESLALVTFFGNLTLLLAMILAIAGAADWRIVAAMFLFKFIPDYILALRAKLFIDGKFFFPIISGLLYPLFSSIVGLYSLYGVYRWKGRTLR